MLQDTCNQLISNCLERSSTLGTTCVALYIPPLFGRLTKEDKRGLNLVERTLGSLLPGSAWRPRRTDHRRASFANHSSVLPDSRLSPKVVASDFGHRQIQILSSACPAERVRNQGLAASMALDRFLFSHDLMLDGDVSSGQRFDRGKGIARAGLWHYAQTGG